MDPAARIAERYRQSMWGRPDPARREFVRAETQKVAVIRSQILAWLRGKFRHQVFSMERNGNSDLEFAIKAGPQTAFTIRSYPPYEMNPPATSITAWVGNTGRGAQTIWSNDQGRGKPPAPLPAPRVLVSVVRSHLQGKAIVDVWRRKNLSPEVSQALQGKMREVWQAARDRCPGVSLSLTSKGSYAEGRYEASVEYDGEEHWPQKAVWVLCDVKRKEFKIGSFGETAEYRTIRSYATGLNRVGTLINKGIRGLDPSQKAMVKGTMTTDVIRRVTDARVSFSGVDEWHSTQVTVTLALGTKKPVPKKIIRDWLKSNWHSVVVPALPKFNPPESAPDWEAEGYRDYEEWEGDYNDMPDHYIDTHETPSVGLGWLDPSRQRFTDAEEHSIAQEGNRVTVSMGFTHR